MKKNPVIQFEKVSFSYSAGVALLRDVSFSILEKDFACVIGPNGGGKTTLLMLMLGLLHADAGRVAVLGGTPTVSRGKIGYMPQYTQLDQQFPADVMDVVSMGRLRPGLHRFTQRDHAHCMDALAEMGVETLCRRSFCSLSGGQRQRVLVARALAGEPEILLLDEPTANVDPVAQDQFYETLEALNQRLTIVIVSHDLGLVSSRMDRVLCVNEGVRIHPVSEIDGRVIEELYGSKMNLVRHDHCCSEQGHSHA